MFVELIKKGFCNEETEAYCSESLTKACALNPTNSGGT